MTPENIHLPGSGEFIPGRGGDCYPRSTMVGEAIPVWAGERCPIVPRDKLVTQPSWEWAEYQDLYQDGDPSCMLHAMGNAIMFFLAMFGRARSTLDARKAWIECTGGRGGYAIDDGLLYAMKKGFPTADGSERIFVAEAYDAPTVEDAFSVVACGYPLVYGHFVPGGHAECGTRIVIDPDGPKMDTRGSWGKAYQGRAYHLVDWQDLQRGIATFGAFAIRELKIRACDVDSPDAKEVS